MLSSLGVGVTRGNENALKEEPGPLAAHLCGDSVLIKWSECCQVRGVPVIPALRRLRECV